MTPNKSNMDDAGDTKVSQVMNPENSTAGAGLQFNTTGLDPKEICYLYVVKQLNAIF